MRLIDADALIEYLEKNWIPANIDAIDAQPTIEPEQRTGEWLRYGEDGNPNEEDTVFWQCDQCLETYTGRTTRIPNYCPNCGADMRGECIYKTDFDGTYICHLDGYEIQDNAYDTCERKVLDGN